MDDFSLRITILSVYVTVGIFVVVPGYALGLRLPSSNAGGMGEVGTTLSHGGFTGYWNPANLAYRSGTFDVDLEGRFELTDPNNFLDKTNKAIELTREARSDPTPTNVREALNQFNKIEDLSAQLQPDGAFGLRYGSMSLYVISNNIGGLSLRGDTITEGDPDEFTGQFITHRIREVGVSYGYDFSSFLAVGIGLKMMGGSGQKIEIPFSNLEDAQSQLRRRTEGFELQDTRGSVDLGLSVRPTENLRISLMGRNLNEPEFQFDDRIRLEPGPNLRGGLSLHPYGWWVVAMDMDFTEENKLVGLDDSSRIVTRKVQDLGVGTRFELVENDYLGLGIQTGYSTNLAEPRVDGYYTTGISLRTWFAKLSLNGGINSEFEANQGGYGQISLNFSS